MLLFLVGLMALLPPPIVRETVPRVERIYWDHVEGFFVDSVGKEIYAGSRDRLYHSSDFGKHWLKLGELPDMTLIKQIIPIDRRTILINASRNEFGKAYLSTDSGHTFRQTLDLTGAGSSARFIPEERKLYSAVAAPFI